MTTGTPISEQVSALAEKSAARLADLDRREERLKKAELDLQNRAREIEASTRELGERLALVRQGELDLAARVTAAAGEFRTLAKAQASAEEARVEYEGVMARVREITARPR